MKIGLLFFLCLLGVILNTPVSVVLTDVSLFVPIFEFFLFFYVSKSINDHFLRNYSGVVRNKFFSLYLIGFLISLFLLGLCWTPNLPPNSPDWGFDPQRYYRYAQEVLKNGYYEGWVGSGMNGIVYFYTFVFRILGCHPLIPLYLNSILALTSVLMLLNVFKERFRAKAHYLALLFFIPEIQYYNVMVSKDILCQYGVVFILYEFYKYYSLRKINNLIILFIAFLMVMLIRFPYAIAALFAIILFLLFFSDKFSFAKKIMVLLVMSGVALYGLSKISILSASDAVAIDWGTLINETMTGKMNAEEGGSFLTAALTPHNVWEVFVFGIIRSVAYLFPPLYIRFFDQQNWYTFAGTTYILTGLVASVVIIVVFQYIIHTFKNKEPKAILLVMFFLILLFLTGFSTPHFIHHRYRATYEMLYFMLVILSYVDLGKRKFIGQIRKVVLVVLLLFPFLIFKKL